MPPTQLPYGEVIDKNRQENSKIRSSKKLSCESIF